MSEHLQEFIIAVNKLKYILIACVMIPAVLVTVYIVKSERDHDIRNKEFIKNITYEIEYGLGGGIGYQERFNKYLKFCVRIWNVHGHTYYKPSKWASIPEAMSPDQALIVKRLNFRLAEAMGFANPNTGEGYYDIISKGILESALNPNAIGPFEEWSWLQMKRIAVDYAYGIYCGRLRSVHNWVEIRNIIREELGGDIVWAGDMESLAAAYEYEVDQKDKKTGKIKKVKKYKYNDKAPALALCFAYFYAWAKRVEYNGDIVWGASMYHWGDGFLGKYYRLGIIPRHFEIETDGKKEEYSPLKYFIKWAKMKDALNNGDVEAGKAIAQKWDDYARKMVKEEEQLLRGHEAIRNLNKQIKNYEGAIKKEREARRETDKELEIAKKAAHEANVKYRAIYHKVKVWEGGPIKDWLYQEGLKIAKIYVKDTFIVNRKENMFTIIVISIAVFIVLAILGIIIGCTIAYMRLRKKFKRIQQK